MKNLTLMLFIIFKAHYCFGQDSTSFKNVYYQDGSFKIQIDTISEVNDCEDCVDRKDVYEYYSPVLEAKRAFSICDTVSGLHDFTYWKPRLKKVINYRNNVKHGVEFGYWMSSEVEKCYKLYDEHYLKYYGKWYKGQKSGSWEYFDASGNMILKEFYKKGVLVKTKKIKK